MKFMKIISLLLTVTIMCSLTACGKKADADVLMREAKTNANAIQNCSATISSTLEFTANGKQNAFKTGNEIVYWAKPFALKSNQTSLLGDKADNGVFYTVTDGGNLWFYTDSGSGWQKTSAQNMGTTPLEQIDILRLLGSVSGQKYARGAMLGSQKVHKLELTFQSEVLRSTIENIVTTTGMGQGSQTVVQTLLDSAPAVYGYCYIDESTGQITRVELDATEAVNRIFQSIDGSNITINVSKCEITGDISNIGKAPAVELPPQAAAAQTVQAAG